MFLWGEHKMPTHAINGDMKTLDLLSIKLPGRCKRGGLGGCFDLTDSQLWKFIVSSTPPVRYECQSGRRTGDNDNAGSVLRFRCQFQVRPMVK